MQNQGVRVSFRGDYEELNAARIADSVQTDPCPGDFLSALEHLRVLQTDSGVAVLALEAVAVVCWQILVWIILN